MRMSCSRRSPSPGEASDVFSECGWIDMKWLQFVGQQGSPLPQMFLKRRYWPIRSFWHRRARRLRFGERRRGCLGFASYCITYIPVAAAVNNKYEWGRVGEGMEIYGTLKKDRGANT